MDELQSLMDAVRQTPDNLPLRKYLCAELLRRGRWEEAEVELKDALRGQPQDLELKLGLATAFCEQKKTFNNYNFMWLYLSIKNFSPPSFGDMGPFSIF